MDLKCNIIMSRLNNRQLEQIKFLATDNSGDPLSAVQIAKRMGIDPSTVRNRLRKHFNYKLKSKGFVDIEGSKNIVDYRKKERVLVAPKTWIYVDKGSSKDTIQKAKDRYTATYDGVRGKQYNHKKR